MSTKLIVSEFAQLMHLHFNEEFTIHFLFISWLEHFSPDMRGTAKRSRKELFVCFFYNQKQERIKSIFINYIYIKEINKTENDAMIL